MPPRKKRSKRTGTVSLSGSLKGLIEAIAEQVVQRLHSELPTRDDVKSLERHLRTLSRQVRTGARKAARGRVGRPPTDRRCKLNACNQPHVARGYCSMHYQAWRRRKMARQK